MTVTALDERHQDSWRFVRLLMVLREHMLTHGQIRNFKENGFVPSRISLPANKIASARATVEKIFRDGIDRWAPTRHPRTEVLKLGDPQGAFNWKIANIRLSDSTLLGIATNEAMAQEVSQLLGNVPIRIWRDQLIAKPSREGPAVRWHYDASYWTALSNSEQITAWIALDLTTKENGCLCLIKGSHRWGDQLANCRRVLNDLPISFEGTSLQRVDAFLEPGQVHYHHALTWHGSHPNTSGSNRYGFAVHFMSASTEYQGNIDESSLQFVWPPELGIAAQSNAKVVRHE